MKQINFGCFLCSTSQKRYVGSFIRLFSMQLRHKNVMWDHLFGCFLCSYVTKTSCGIIYSVVFYAVTSQKRHVGSFIRLFSMQLRHKNVMWDHLFGCFLCSYVTKTSCGIIYSVVFYAVTSQKRHVGSFKFKMGQKCLILVMRLRRTSKLGKVSQPSDFYVLGVICK